MTPAQNFSLSRERWLLFFFIAGVLLVEFFTQTRGIHFDENNYLRLALYNQIGDARNDGKQPLFYVLSYLLSNTVGFLFGRGRIQTPYFGYLLLNALGLAWLACRLPWSRRQRWCFVAVLLASPLYLLNSTQLMMETPMLGLECLLFGALLPTVRAPRWLMPTCVCLLVLIKESALPAILALAIGIWIWDRAQTRGLVKWAVIAVVLMKVLRVICRVREQRYGGFLNALHFGEWPARLSHTGAYFTTWVFLTGPVLIAAAVFWFQQRRKSDGELARGLFAVGLMTLPLTLFVELSVTIDFARYLYPLFWIGVLAWATLVVDSLDARWATAAIAGSALASSALWVPRVPEFLGWPAFITDDLYFNRGTVLVGFPVHGWTVRAQWRFPKLCLLATPPAEGENDGLRDYFRHAFPGTQFFDETQHAQFAACDGAKAIVLRGSIDPNDCQCAHDFPYTIAECTTQPISDGTIVRNLTCLP